MRSITGHKVNPANDKIAITVTDQPGAGGANHRYTLSGFNLSSNPSATEDEIKANPVTSVILFQNGPIAESGVNGVTQEVLLAIVADRLRSFQTGPFSCKENAVALTHIETAMLWLHKRTWDRMARGVEGTHNK